MSLIEWREEFLLEIPSVDHEHRELIRIINDLYDSFSAHESKVTVMDFLGELHAKIAAHFALEEKIMLDRQYDQYREHKTDHERLLDDIRDFMDDFEEGREFPEGVFRNLLELWFVSHFREKDARLHKYLA